jgi:hypothetical protein
VILNDLDAGAAIHLSSYKAQKAFPFAEHELALTKKELAYIKQILTARIAAC